jgi:hypothetical protein
MWVKRRTSMSRFKGQYIVDEKGRKTILIIPVKEYESF